ncbi:MAG: Rap1a/Tai family immunity protein [Stellaceae bacterium]
MNALTLITAAALGLAVASAHAEAPTGNELYAKCTSKQVDDLTSCLGYMRGVADASPEICPGDSVTAGQLRLVFIRRSESDPRFLPYGQFAAIFEALRGAFPCHAGISK